MSKQHLVIVGAGIVGLATAYHLQKRFPHLAITLLEKEASIAQHQSSHNSGVLHSGIYYRPGSLKARLCREGKQQMEQFCLQKNIPYERCGKLIIATSPEELPVLRTLYERGQMNGVQCALLSDKELQHIEPHARGIKAIHVPEAGIVDFYQVCLKLAEHFQEKGGTLRLNHLVKRARIRGNSVHIHTSQGRLEADYLINCAGLYADVLAQHSGIQVPVRIIPFRGEYFQLKPEFRHLCRGLIYPVPDPSFPFLGIHLTRTIHKTVLCGPNAVLACAREGYTRSRIHPGECLQTLTYPGFIKLAARYWRTGIEELLRSWSKEAFVRALQRMVPEITSEMLTSAPAGVRAQALSPDGQLVDDFLFIRTPRMLHVCNAPSPAATSSLRIGEWICQEATQLFEGLSSTTHR